MGTVFFLLAISGRSVQTWVFCLLFFQQQNILNPTIKSYLLHHRRTWLSNLITLLLHNPLSNFASPNPKQEKDNQGQSLAILYLQSTVHHSHNVVKLLVVQDCSVLFNVLAELLSQAVPSCLPLQGSQGCRQGLQRRTSHFMEMKLNATAHTE